MKRTAFGLVVTLALCIVLLASVPAQAATSSGVGPGIVCAPCSGGGSGLTGCWQITTDHSAGLPYFSWVRHYLVVNYCLRYGIFTAVSIVAHGCDTRGLAFCHTGPAWLSGGGVGAGYATFEAHAEWGVTIVPIYNNTDKLTLSPPTH